MARSYLIGFLYDATRVVPYAAFALLENTSAFLPVLRQAVMRPGVPLRLYVDNGSAFRCKRRSIDDLMRAAEACRVANVLRPYLDAIA